MDEHAIDGPLLLFDGECNVCNASVQFVIRRDPGALFRFASLQSALGQRLCTLHHIPAGRADTLVLIDDAGAHVRSTAVLRVARALGFPWKLAYVFIVVPPWLRDLAYRAFASMRYRLFGRRTTCMVPTAEQRRRFLSE
jgi:predicted DCC family thiol-disulfide oxidoreductase YuxK